ncbi:MAG: hypothetical protein AB8G15_12845 [Saprospiraceae bacterium]
MKIKLSFFYLSSLFIFFSACTQNHNQVVIDLATNFKQQKQAFFADQMALVPKLPAFEASKGAQLDQLLRQYRDDLSAINPERLTAPNRVTFAYLQQFITDAHVNYTLEHTYLWDPSFYNTSQHFKAILSDSSLTTTQKLAQSKPLVLALPAHYKTAIQNLQNNELSIRRVAAAKEDLFQVFHTLKYKIPKLAAQEQSTDDLADPANAEALFAIKDYLAFCKSLVFEYGEAQSFVRFRDSLPATASLGN